MNLGAMHHLMGKLESAEDFYQKALVIQPNNQVLIDNIKRLQNQKKKT